MAIVFDPRWRAFDALGNGYSGALLYVYDAGTSTPSTIYTDAALTTPSANPVVADSTGVFPQWYGADGALYDVTQKTSGGVTLKSQTNITAVGASTGAITRDFTTSRFAARGAGGVTYVEAGPASPTNTGGHLSLNGWNGTQADQIDINAVLVAITGRLKENGYKLPGIVRSEAVTFAAAANVAIPLTNDPTGVRAWEIDLIDFAQSASTTLSIRFSYDGGATFASGATYASAVAMNSGTGGSYVYAYSAAGSTSAQISMTQQPSAIVPGLIKLQIVTPNSGAVATMVQGRISGWNGAQAQDTTFSALDTTGGRATHVRITPASGTISGTCRVVPLRGLGET